MTLSNKTTFFPNYKDTGVISQSWKKRNNKCLCYKILYLYSYYLSLSIFIAT